MKNTAFLVAASAAFVSSQATLNSTTGKWTCALPNVAYCDSDSLKTDIIIRCDANKNGQPGRCGDNLDGEPPVGNFPALCYQPDATSGTAACEKNCVVYGGSGNGNGTFTLPLDICKPTFVASTSTVSSTGYPSGTGSTSVPGPSSTDVLSTARTTVTSKSTTTTCPESTVPLSTATGGGSPAGGNGTCTTLGGSGSGSGSPTNTPPAPTKSIGTGNPISVPTAGATANRVGGTLAALGLLVAYFL